ncbi:DUF6090 family protein [Fulvivirga sedimenti]|uniref:Uncharacterized protein n=1 Tax=Fulvivirga sedimenti TaxID=2879465 RepID=A0A9X1KVR5_9BACT|nr:DUF6090 family protein [Fulvivirga sedimenti]MCA6073970.1 hypothetical protein [Fulvivirga sedimenti]
MISFFRKFRQQFLAENKFTRYLLYAIGEIILVVIGILIALSINTWNENRHNRTFELKMLKEIEKALEQDYYFFTYHLIGFRNQTELQAVDFFDRAIVSKNAEKDSIDYHFNRLLFGLQVTLNRGPYDALKASGIDKISNDSLRNKLIFYYDFFVPRYKGLVEFTMSTSSEKMEPLIEELSFPSRVIVTDSTVLRPNRSLKQIDLETSETFNQLLYITKDRASNTRELLEQMTPSMLELRALLQQEISK